MQCVYIARDGDTVLYVGCTGNIHERIRHHCSIAPWWTPTVTVEVRPMPDRPSALAAERRLIAEFNPPQNTLYTDRPKAERGAKVEAILAALADGPLSTSELRKRLGYKNTAAVAQRLHFDGTIKAIGYEPHGSRSGWMATWALADHPAPAVPAPDSLSEIPHGAPHGRSMHEGRGEAPCAECIESDRRRQRERYAERKRKAVA